LNRCLAVSGWYLRMNSMKLRFMRNTVRMLISSSARRVLPFVRMRFAAELMRSA
jgi:hypothetical protein